MKANWRFINQICLVVIFSISYSNCFAKTKEVQMAILMPAPAKTIHKNWQPLADYLSKKIGQPVKIITPRGLKQAKEAIPKADFIYANSYLYSILKKDSKLTAIAQMKNIGGSVYSRGRFLVRNDSTINSVDDLKGKKMALISPYGAGAYLAPRAYLNKQGIDIEKDVDVEFTRNLKKAAYMVMLGKADTAVMCDVSYKILSQKIDTGELRFFDKTDAFPEALMFTSQNPKTDLVKQFQQALTDENSLRKNALKPLHNMKILSFVPYDIKVENRIRQLNEDAGF